jgi:hypothetical protein
MPDLLQLDPAAALTAGVGVAGGVAALWLLYSLVRYVDRVLLLAFVLAGAGLPVFVRGVDPPPGFPVHDARDRRDENPAATREWWDRATADYAERRRHWEQEPGRQACRGLWPLALVAVVAGVSMACYVWNCWYAGHDRYGPGRRPSVVPPGG